MVIFIIGLLVCLSSDSYFGIWVGLEICNLCVLPWLINEKSEVIYSVIFKYFIIQASSSVFIYFGIVIMWGFWNLFYGMWLFMIGLILKVGGIFVGVFLSIIESLSWWGVCVILGVQKVPIIPILIYISEGVTNYMILVFGLILGISSVWVCSVLSLRSFILLSSTLNISWVFCSLSASYTTTVGYFMFYLTCFLLVCMLFYSRSGIDYCSIYYGITITVIESVALLIISGIPPFGMFFIKVNIIVELILSNFLLECWFLVILSTFILYMYVNLAVGNLFLGILYGINNYNSVISIQCAVLICFLFLLWCLI